MTNDELHALKGQTFQKKGEPMKTLTVESVAPHVGYETPIRFIAAIGQFLDVSVAQFEAEFESITEKPVEPAKPVAVATETQE